MPDEKKKLMLQGLQDIAAKRVAEKQQDYIQRGKTDLERSKNLTSGTLDKDAHIARGSAGPEIHTPERQIVKGANPAIVRPPVQDILSGQEFQDKNMKRKLSATMKKAIAEGDDQMMNKLRMIAKKIGKGASTGLKTLPVIGSLAGLLGAQDASAAVPGLDSAESVGPQKGSLQDKLEQGTITPEERKQLRAEALANMLKSQQ